MLRFSWSAVARIAVFNRSFAGVFGLAAVAGLACWLLRGTEATLASIRDDSALIRLILPKFGAAFLIAGFARELLPRALIARWIGEHSGLTGITLATGAGIITPGGPITSFPLVSAMHEAGTGQGALIAYLTSWATLGFQRILVWELPLMGPEFVILRLLVSLPLPVLAGVIGGRLSRRRAS